MSPLRARRDETSMTDLREDLDLFVEAHLGGVGVQVHDELGSAYREVVRQPSRFPTALYLGLALAQWVEYSLTGLGRSLEPILLAMLEWGVGYLEQRSAAEAHNTAPDQTRGAGTRQGRRTPAGPVAGDGGTVALGDGGILTAKVPSTPRDQSEGVMNAIEASEVEAGAFAGRACELHPAAGFGVVAAVEVQRR